ncbi:hypothetical protein [Parasulfuritortus cantonensis]|uniref:hypothetical protein n=1 Tax=Parasulfuritortus cantonensis TaxID=2528202 RepID=UPI00197D3585|nr:hypothetical protein [Parasulfuritortus cantonensis]
MTVAGSIKVIRDEIQSQGPLVCADPNKAQDLEKKREKALLKEFETYKAFTGRKIKEIRALRYCACRFPRCVGSQGLSNHHRHCQQAARGNAAGRREAADAL